MVKQTLKKGKLRHEVFKRAAMDKAANDLKTGKLKVETRAQGIAQREFMRDVESARKTAGIQHTRRMTDLAYGFSGGGLGSVSRKVGASPKIARVLKSALGLPKLSKAAKSLLAKTKPAIQKSARKVVASPSLPKELMGGVEKAPMSRAGLLAKDQIAKYKASLESRPPPSKPYKPKGYRIHEGKSSAKALVGMSRSKGKGLAATLDYRSKRFDQIDYRASRLGKAGTAKGQALNKLGDKAYDLREKLDKALYDRGNPKVPKELRGMKPASIPKPAKKVAPSRLSAPYRDKSLSRLDRLEIKRLRMSSLTSRLEHRPVRNLTSENRAEMLERKSRKMGAIVVRERDRISRRSYKTLSSAERAVINRAKTLGVPRELVANPKLVRSRIVNKLDAKRFKSDDAIDAASEFYFSRIKTGFKSSAGLFNAPSTKQAGFKRSKSKGKYKYR